MTVKKNKITAYKPADLLQIHNDKASENYHWLSILRGKEVYSQSRSSIMQICHIYGVPMRQLSERGQLLFSQPAFDYVLTNTPELFSTSQEDTADARLSRLQNEAENEIKAELKTSYEKRLKASIEATS
jgi:hypothetical protein